jgi:sialate O-acetylesterase
MRRLLLSCVVGLSVVSPVIADVKLPAVFSDHMVLQRDRAIPVWGWADPGEKVTVSIQQKEKTVTAKPDGSWRVDLDSVSAGGPINVTVKGHNTITLNDVLIGEVWICGGQSNMEWKLENCSDAQSAIESAADPEMRLFQIEHTTADAPQKDCKAVWAKSDATSAAPFSGVGFHFGKILRKELKVPVGLIQPTWGGTPAEAWMSDSALREGDRYAGLFKRIEEWKQSAAAEQAEYDKAVAAWQDDAKKAKAQGEKPPKKPAQPKSIRQPLYPSTLYNGMIAPVAPFASRGVIWYQGEANAERAHQYRALLPALIKDWRRAWENESMPFGIVQLANLGPVYAKPIEPSIWCELRDAQLQTVREVPNTGLAIAVDIGDEKSIHPTNKAEVGRRLSLWALAKVYGQAIAYSGPVFEKQTIEDGAIRLSFAFADGLRPRDGSELQGFAIAGENQKFAEADATIEGNEIVVKSPQVKKPVAVRYAWKKNPVCNLVNAAGLPASPFKTDNWPDATADRE